MAVPHLSIYSPIDRHLRYFQFLAIPDKATMDIYVQVLNGYMLTFSLVNA